MDPITAISSASAEKTTELFASVITSIGRKLAGNAKSAAVKALAKLEGYGAYLEETNNRVATYKSFAKPAEPVDLLDHFVTTTLSIDEDSNFDQTDIVEFAANRSNVVISATAGYGKSMIMRYVALALYNNPRGTIPIFIELRHLNRMKSPDLLTFIHATYNRLSVVEREAFDQNLRNGVFSFLLDGFDELNHEIRPQVESQILSAAKEYPTNSFIVSGRPDDRFESWRLFSVYQIKPMQQTQVIELLNKLDYDRGTTKRFIDKINSGLYETHDSFLSTPLLAILMLLTFQENADIPDKMHLFYGKAFETLYHKHDALKEQYDRARKSGLQIDQFSRAFAVFCLNTYVREKIEFTRTELIEFINQSIDFYNFKLDPEDLIFDLEEAVCLIQREGLSYFFVHRSFQEYFTAIFLSSCPEDVRDTFIDKVCTRYWDNVLPMLFDMASDQIEPSWVTRNIDEYLAEVGTTEDKTDPLDALFPAIIIHVYENRTILYSLGSSKYQKFFAVLRRFYDEEFSRKAPEVDYARMEAEAHLLPGFEENAALAESETTVFGKEGRVVMLDFDERHKQWLTDVGLRAHAKFLHDTVVRIRKSVRKDLKDRNEFLSGLFER